MRILIVSYYAEKHLYISTAQNTRFLASELLVKGHEVKVVCAGENDETILQDGYQLTKLPLYSNGLENKWLGSWRPNKRVHRIAKAYIDDWQPDIIYMGAWKYLSEFAFVGFKRKIPIVQLVHDYSIVCMRNWLIDSWGKLCDGPTTLKKCMNCVRYSIGWRSRSGEFLLSMPLIGRIIQSTIAPRKNAGLKFRFAISEAFTHMIKYRKLCNLFIAQTPSVIDILVANGVKSHCCRLLPQYIGEEKLIKYERPIQKKLRDRPMRIVFVGRFSSEKGVDLLIKAYLSLKTNFQVELWLISNNLSEKKLKRYLTGRIDKKKNILVFNKLTGAEVSKKIAQTDFCVVPSICREVASRVVLEANAQSLPVIASDTVGNCYIIKDGINGRIFPSGDAQSLKNIFQEIIDNPNILIEWSRNVVQPIMKKEWISLATTFFSEVIENQRCK